ncbi:hypothetical protein QL285_018409 [Trifolium repens]|nr:hypothetical protein QL285_018409 [Trifolium repens]
MDRSWMYDRTFLRRKGLKRRFTDGVEEFLNIVRVSPIVLLEGGIRCPCVKCKCMAFKSEEEIRLHLYNTGFKDNYLIWTSHGERVATTLNLENRPGPSSSTRPVIVPDHQPFDMVDNMISNALGVNLSYDPSEEDVTDSLPNEEAQRFYNLLTETNKPLFEGSPHSKLSMCVRLLGLKSQFHVPELALDLMTKMILDGSPIKEKKP